MSNHLKSFALASLVFSLTCGVGLAANDVVVKHTLAQTAASSDGKAEADKLFQDGVQQFRRGEYPKALQTYQRVLEIRRQLGDKVGIGQTLNNLGEVYYWMSEGDKALKVLQEALTIRREINDKSGEGETLDNIGLAYFRLNQNEKGLKVLQQALAIRKQVNDKPGEGKTLSNIGLIYLSLEKHPQALENLQQALAIHEKVTDKFQKGITLQRLGGVYDKDYSRALQWYNEAVTVNQEIGNPVAKAYALRGIGLIYFKQEKYNLAIENFQQALPIFQQIGISSIELYILESIGDSYFRQEQYDQAIKYYQQALPIAQKLKDNSQELSILGSIGDAYFSQNKYEQGITFYQQALPISQKINNKPQEAAIILKIVSTCADLATKYNSSKEYQKAIEFAQQGWNVAKKNQTPTIGILPLSQLLTAYEQLSNYEKIIEISQEALKISANSKIQGIEAEILQSLSKIQAIEYSPEDFSKMYNSVILLVLGKVYDITGEYKKAIPLAEQGLTLAREIKNYETETNALLTLASAYSSLAFTAEEYQKSLQLAQKALKIARKINNKELEVEALYQVANIYGYLNEYQKAIETAKASLALSEDIKNPAAKIQPLLTLATTYLDLGEYDKFNQYSQEALNSARQIKEHPVFDTTALLLVMVNHFIQGDYQKTIDLAQEGLNSSKNILSNHAQKFDVINLLFTGAGYAGLKDYEKAIEYSQKVLELSKQIKDPNSEFMGLIFSGSFYRSAGKTQQAINSYRQALTLASKTKITSNQTLANAGLARVHRDLNQPNIAIAYYKKAINGFEEVRSNIKGLPKGIEQSFLKSIQFVDKSKPADIYRELAELLITQGRQVEARQVLDLLKIQEIRDFASGTTDTTTKPEILLTETEKKIQTESQSIIALSRQISECEKTDCKEKSQLNDRLTALLTEFNRDLEEIEKEIRDRITTDPNTFRPDSPKAVEIVKSQPGTVMVYPLLMEDKLWLLLYSGDVAKKFEVKVSRSELGTTVKQFRKLMEECEKRAYCGAEDIARIKPVSQKLYNWLIKPIDRELKQNQVKNLVFALDRVTRYVPMSALYDGKQYLIENYTIYNVLSADLTNTTARLPAKIQDTKVLAMGVSDAVGGFPALNNVPQEVDNIVRSSSKDKGIYPGKEYLNKSFDYETLRDNLTGKNILHLATHGEFVPGRDKASYLLLGKGNGVSDIPKLEIDDIQTLAGLSNIHLVVLSACQTALASERQDGVEIASLAYSFINRGAKSVIASLWQVADSSTSTLMQNFYKNLANSKQPITKAEAMRLAELQLLYNKEVTVSDIKRAGGLIPEGLQSSGKKPESKTFAHPYYWSPFVLIGNGL